MAITVYTYNDKVLKNVATDKWLKKAAVPFGPTHVALPEGAIRIRVTSGSVPSGAGGPPGFTATNVDGDIWDVINTSDWTYALNYANLKSITVDIIDLHVPDNVTGLRSASIDFNSDWTNLKRINISYGAGITNLDYNFRSPYIEELYLSNMPNLSNINQMCDGASSLKMIPYIEDVSSITTCLSAFSGCVNVESGIVNMYNRLSALSALSPIYYHSNCFTDCGSNTVTGAAELAQIPTSWGGTGA